MAEKHPIHYYANGDIILKVENTHFLVHKPFLSLASEFFNDLFTLATPNSNEKITNANEREGSNLVLEIIEENVSSFQDMLSFIYPNTILDISWENVENLFRIADKFIIKKLTNSCDLFLQNNLIENILTSFRLAYQYRLPIPFKEASKLILDYFLKYESDSEFIQIPKGAREKLVHNRYLYHAALDKFSMRLRHGNVGMKSIFVYPTPKPSIVYSKLIYYCFDATEAEVFTKFQEYLLKFERMAENHPIHYYEDENIILIEDTHFLVHKPFLSLATSVGLLN
ncbi:13747_t:CDS:2 [Funneliformis mosseae]|uniref:13747_t:CDS:1 n=1 Tax=Funneliformis mosseae TaxID=27381 RepID=A0A9N9FXR0_FUNMO|nr:13747_t:CDS:2 [Funneliformis mosseae]